MCAQSSWGKIRLGRRLERGSCFISTASEKNATSVSHGWKSTGPRKDITSILRILFLLTVTGKAGCVIEN